MGPLRPEKTMIYNFFSEISCLFYTTHTAPCPVSLTYIGHPPLPTHMRGQFRLPGLSVEIKPDRGISLIPPDGYAAPFLLILLSFSAEISSNSYYIRTQRAARHLHSTRALHSGVRCLCVVSRPLVLRACIRTLKNPGFA